MKKKPAKKSPSFYRNIPERFSIFTKKNKRVLSSLKFEILVFLYAVMILFIILLVFDLFSNMQRQKKVNFQREKIESEIKLWQDIASKFKNYKEAYYQLAVLEYELGDKEKAKYYLDKSLYIDPNFDKARSFQNILYSY